MNHPQSTPQPITIPATETWKDNPRLVSGQSIATMLTKAGFVLPQQGQ